MSNDRSDFFSVTNPIQKCAYSVLLKLVWDVSRMLPLPIQREYGDLLAPHIASLSLDILQWHRKGLDILCVSSDRIVLLQH